MALYVKLSLPDYTIRVLNGRYPTTRVIDERFKSLDEKLDGLKELFEDKVDRVETMISEHVNNGKSYDRRPNKT